MAEVSTSRASLFLHKGGGRDLLANGQTEESILTETIEETFRSSENETCFQARKGGHTINGPATNGG